MPTTVRYRLRTGRIISVVIAFVVIVVVLGGAGYYGYSALASPAPTTTANLSLPEPEPSADPPLPGTSWPDAGAGAISIVDRGVPISEFGSEDPRPIASITKTITALVVLDEHPLGVDEEGPSIAVTESDAELYQRVIAEDGSSAPVYPGTSLSQRDMLEALMLPSANNYAYSLTRWAFGSDQAFLDAAQLWLDEHGLEDTTVTDPSGLDAGSVSTPRDLLTVGEIALDTPALADVVSLERTTIPSLGELNNTNTLLGSDGVIGIKTGASNAADWNLLFAAEADVDGEAVVIVGALLGQAGTVERNNGVAAALSSTTESLRRTTLIPAGTAVGEYRTEWGETSSVYVEEDVTAILGPSDTPELTAETIALSSGSSDDSVGSLALTSGGTTSEYELRLRTDIEEPSMFWKLANPQFD